MSDEAKEEKPPVIVDGIQANGVNAFVNEKLGIALAIKPVLTDGDFVKWVTGVSLASDTPVVVTRSQLFMNAIKAGILVHCTDKTTADKAKDIEAPRVQWYGSKLLEVYYQYAFVDPN